MNLVKSTSFMPLKYLFLSFFFFAIGKTNAQCPSGDITLSTQQQIDDFTTDYPGCTEIIGSMTIGTAGYNDNVSNLNGLSQIASITGDLNINYNNLLTNLDGLNSLTSVGGNLFIHYNDVLESLEGLENVNDIGGDLLLWYNFALPDITGLNNVTSIFGDVDISSNDVLVNLMGLNNLTFISGGLRITDNSSLVNFSGLSSLNAIGDNLYVEANGDLNNFEGLDNLTIINGNVSILDNDALTNLEGLNNLSSIGGGVSIGGNYYLVNLMGLESLSSVSTNVYIGGNSLFSQHASLSSLTGLDNLATIGGSLVIQNNTALTSFGSGLKNLNSIGGSLRIIETDLVNLQGLENLMFIHDNLDIHDNPYLTSLIGLNNLSNQYISAVSIHHNYDLSECGLLSICDILSNLSSSAITVYLNDPGCNSSSEVITNCQEALGTLKANAFYDINQDKIQNNDEPDYPGAPILIEPTSVFYYTQSGLYFIDPGSYTATLDQANLSDWELTTDSTSYFLSLETGQTDTITFGIYPTQQVSHIQTIINSAATRCNEVITLNVTTTNLGTTIASGTMWLTIDDAIPAFTFIHQPDTVVTNVDAYGWHFTDLYPGQSVIKKVDVTIPGPPDFELGQRLLFVSFSNFVDENGEDSSEGFRYNPEVRCSYDPNDKLVNPAREGDYALFDEDLIYTVRFQNTGNDVAYDVVILDTLDANFDHETFRLLGSSHAEQLNTSMNADGVVTFEFRDIFLPDSTSNFEGSQGYVSYLIRTIDGLAENTPVTNSASIYFDLNPPIITNTTQSIMVSELPTVSVQLPDNELNFSIIPNPNTGTFYIRGATNGTYRIFNTMGQIISSGLLNDSSIIDIPQATSGIYFIEIRDEEQVGTRRFVKQ